MRMGRGTQEEDEEREPLEGVGGVLSSWLTNPIEYRHSPDLLRISYSRIHNGQLRVIHVHTSESTLNPNSKAL